jgi:hypothetical protein
LPSSPISLVSHVRSAICFYWSTKRSAAISSNATCSYSTGITWSIANYRRINDWFALILTGTRIVGFISHVRCTIFFLMTNQIVCSFVQWNCIIVWHPIEYCLWGNTNSIHTWTFFYSLIYLSIFSKSIMLSRLVIITFLIFLHFLNTLLFHPAMVFVIFFNITSVRFESHAFWSIETLLRYSVLFLFSIYFLNWETPLIE